MAKDFTNRGNTAGNPRGAGRKAKPLAEKVTNGRAKGAKVMDAPESPDIDELYGVEMPPPDDYLTAQQKDGKPFGAERIYAETWKWLAERKCEKLVNTRLIEAYAQAFARYIQCEEAISVYGFLGKHPTTGGMIASPFVQMSQAFLKQANLLWYQIFQIVKENCSVPFMDNPNDDMMERLLNGSM
ncbi:MAG: P27 family phage terminase small subunit [Defluviitaleaceae bacterium]|nr:P27 family phage terminase small subunit [Defluviitaleaceae bacterium]